MANALNPIPKSMVKSKTIIGGAIAVAAGVAGLFGIDLDAQTQSSIVTTAIDVASAVGGLLAIWGRLKATHVIK